MGISGIGYARIHQKTTGISTWDYGTEAVVANRCHVQALLTTSQELWRGCPL